MNPLEVTLYLMPNEILQEICYYLSWKDILNMFKTEKKLYERLKELNSLEYYYLKEHSPEELISYKILFGFYNIKSNGDIVLSTKSDEERLEELNELLEHLQTITKYDKTTIFINVTIGFIIAIVFKLIINIIHNKNKLL
jgi:hypothetical protein